MGTVYVKDEAGPEHKIALGQQAAGQIDYKIDPKELGLAEGKYTRSVVTETGEEAVPIEVGGVVNNVRIPLDGSATMLNIARLGEVPYNYISQFGMNSPSNNTDTRKA